MDTSEKNWNARKKLFAGAGLISLLGASVMNCETGSGGGGNYNESTSQSKYGCECKGNGLITIVEVYAPSLSSAESFATKQCKEDYPGVGCACYCVKARSSSGGGEKDNHPPCNEVPDDYEGACRNTDW